MGDLLYPSEILIRSEDFTPRTRSEKRLVLERYADNNFSSEDDSSSSLYSSSSSYNPPSPETSLSNFTTGFTNMSIPRGVHEDRLLFRSAPRRNSQYPHIPLERLQKYFKYPLRRAAMILHICDTNMKKICRYHGFKRWPHRRLVSLQKCETHHREIATSSKSTQWEKRQSRTELSKLATVKASIIWPRATIDFCDQKEEEEQHLRDNNDESVLHHNWKMEENDYTTSNDYVVCNLKLVRRRERGVRLKKCGSLSSTTESVRQVDFDIFEQEHKEEESLQFRHFATESWPLDSSLQFDIDHNTTTEPAPTLLQQPTPHALSKSMSDTCNPYDIGLFALASVASLCPHLLKK